MNSEDFTRDPLWPILVETVHTLVLYPHHKAYVERVILFERPDIGCGDLAISLGISMGEAIVLLHELRMEGIQKKSDNNK